MSIVEEKDTKSTGYLKSTDLPDKKAVELILIDYSKTEDSGQYADETGHMYNYGWEIIDKKLREEFALPDGTVKMTCNSKRLRRAIFDADVDIGDTIKLTVEGEGFSRQYKVVKK